MKKLIILIAMFAQSLCAQSIHQYLVRGDTPYVPDSLFGKQMIVVEMYTLVYESVEEMRESDPFYLAAPVGLSEQRYRNIIIARYDNVDYVFIIGEEMIEIDNGDILIIEDAWVEPKPICLIASYKAGEIDGLEHVEYLMINGN